MRNRKLNLRQGVTAGLVIAVVSTAVNLRNGPLAALETAVACLVGLGLVLVIAVRAR